MAKTVTLAAMRARVQFLAHVQNSIAILPADVDAEINTAIGELWKLLLRHRGDAYVKEQTPAPTTTAGSDVVVLASDFLSLLQVEVLDGGNYHRLPKHNALDRGVLAATTSSPGTLRYRFQAAASGASPVLRLVPTPAAVWTLRVSYHPCFTTLVADADTFDGVNGYENFVFAESVAQIKRRESMPGGEWVAKAEAIRKEIIGDAGELDSGTPFTLGNPDRSGRLDDDYDGHWWP